ncbi:MAG: hypothetical protein IPF99_31710 [Deltaproteobacteria bacterium]|nr:hypothetical protein [Deltaproteobacteria bacterium]
MTTAPWVHPDIAARIEWFARSVAEPLRAARTDVDPVRHLLTPCISEWFAALPVLPVTRVADLFAAFTLADLERCIDVRTYDDCSRALLLRHGVEADALANIVRSPPDLVTHGGRGRAVPVPSVTGLVEPIPSTPAVAGHMRREHRCVRTRAACEMAAPRRAVRSIRRTRYELANSLILAHHLRPRATTTAVTPLQPAASISESAGDGRPLRIGG